MTCCKLVDRTFDDKRLAVVVLLSWLAAVVIVFKHLGLLETRYMAFGPSPGTFFMGVVLDTWPRWGLVATFTFLNTCMNDFFSDSISPWILNTITDHKTRFIPYPKAVCLLISQAWAVYCNIMSVLGMMVALSQIDFVLIRMVADLTVNTYTNLKFMRNKTFSPTRYYDLDMQACSDDREMQACPTFSIEEPESRGLRYQK